MHQEPDIGTVPPRERHESLALAVREYKAGQWLLQAEQKASCFFVILRGQVRILQEQKKIRLLGEQDVFGLESLLLNVPSPYAARALTDCRIATYGAEAVDFFLYRQPRMTHTLLTSTLRQLLQTSHNLATEVDAFAPEDVEVRFYPDGARIIEEDSVGHEFYRLVSSEGGLRVTIRGVEIDRIEQPGEFFGEMACLLSTPRHATVTSSGQSAVQVFEAGKLDIIINDYPELALKLIRSLAARLAQVDKLVKFPQEV